MVSVRHFFCYLLDETLSEYHARGLIPTSLVLDALMNSELKYSINTSYNIFSELIERITSLSVRTHSLEKRRR